MRFRFRIRVRVDDDGDDETPATQGTADQAGRPVNPDWYRQGGRSRFSFREFEVIKEVPARSVADESRLPSLHRLRDACMERYKDEGRCSDVELNTMHHLWVAALGLRELARQEGVKPQAISSRINGLANKAPEFYRWWRRKHLFRQRRSRV